VSKGNGKKIESGKKRREEKKSTWKRTKIPPLNQGIQSSGNRFGEKKRGKGRVLKQKPSSRSQKRGMVYASSSGITEGWGKNSFRNGKREGRG